jgi:hypothetical protein
MKIGIVLFVLAISHVHGFSANPRTNNKLFPRQSIDSSKLNLNMQSSSSDSSTCLKVIGSVGVVSNLIVGYSLYTLKTTGCGFPPGPFGLYGLVEGLAYLVIIGIAGWSVTTKVTFISFFLLAIRLLTLACSVR